ncbi:hypothetical protein PIB30_046890 [Stylosanthes scabra]|uniref:Uncharacterized protein n=1 Tax=Stylosanthes scabra TaxID=79078 RepID=A0ABU6TH04_9FABA|nr:hypothetical protein [Stylosanthes scabra]
MARNAPSPEREEVRPGMRHLSVEFDDNIVLRLLIVFRHVFHQQCVDLWLHRHKTYHACRTDLETRKSSSYASPSNIHDHKMQSVVVGGKYVNAKDVCIDVKEDEDDDGNNRFLRSHLTGHSIIMVSEEGRDDDDDRYKLKLQENAELRIVDNEMKKNNHHQYSHHLLVLEYFFTSPTPDAADNGHKNSIPQLLF